MDLAGFGVETFSSSVSTFDTTPAGRSTFLPYYGAGVGYRGWNDAP